MASRHQRFHRRSSPPPHNTRSLRHHRRRIAPKAPTTLNSKNLEARQKHTKHQPAIPADRKPQSNTHEPQNAVCHARFGQHANTNLRNNLLNQTGFNRLHRHPNATYLPVRKFNLHALQVRLKNARPLLCYVRPDTAALLRLTFPADARTDHALLPRDKTNACHRFSSTVTSMYKNFYRHAQAFSNDTLPAKTDADVCCADSLVNHDHTETLSP